jgi:hypothetical protein
VSYAGPKPACFDSQEQYASWRELARMTHVGTASGACVDCTPEFQQRMIKQKRCENPHVEFHTVCVKVGRNKTALELQGYVRFMPKESEPC